MNIEDMIFNGATDEEIQKALDQIKAEKARQEEALRAEVQKKAEAAQKEQRKEALKAEARAYALNAIIAYAQAFDLLNEDEEFSEEDMNKAESMLKRIEDIIPLYAKLIKMQEEMENDFDLGDFLMGFGGDR